VRFPRSLDPDHPPARATVMGLGAFGAGIAATRHLAALGVDVLVTDLAGGATLAPSLAKVEDLIDSGAVTTRLGTHNVSDFTDTDLIVVSPAVPRPAENRFLRAAGAAGVPITTEVRLGLERLDPAGFVRARERGLADGDEAARERGGGASRIGDATPGPVVVGVTGTAGKSTTAAMIRHALDALGMRVDLAGNIGRSLLEPGLLAAPPEVLVLELSSAQLHWLRAGAGFAEAPTWRPHVAVVTGFAPNHLDWHGSLDDYRDCKLQLITQPAGGATRPRSIVLGPSLASWRGATGRGEDLWAELDAAFDPAAGAGHTLVRDDIVDAPFVSDLEMRLPGRHNRVNAVLAGVGARAAAAGVVDLRGCIAAAASFDGLPHRLELAHRTAALRAFDDSKCTTPQGVALAVAAFEGAGEVGADRVVLIAGGYDKGVDLSPMCGAAARCARVFTIGATGEALAESINGAGGHAVCVGSLDAAVASGVRFIGGMMNRTCGAAAASSVLLLSPGCASWDQFGSYEERGRRFTELVRTATRVGEGGEERGG
jgi:UDP-N-acetylmuramoylalanine--D-glutamate ligase